MPAACLDATREDGRQLVMVLRLWCRLSRCGCGRGCCCGCVRRGGGRRRGGRDGRRSRRRDRGDRPFEGGRRADEGVDVRAEGLELDAVANAREDVARVRLEEAAIFGASEVTPRATRCRIDHFFLLGE